MALAVSVSPTAADLLGLSSSGLHRERRQEEKTHRERRFVGVGSQRSERADRLEKSLVAANWSAEEQAEGTTARPTLKQAGVCVFVFVPLDCICTNT